jgi:putative NADPH-quinone reductase
MNSRRILLIDGHPDTDPKRYVHALARAYAEGAKAAGHEVRRLAIGELRFKPLLSAEEFQHGRPPDCIAAAQRDVLWADHVVLLFPLWLGSMPALLKGFVEQLLRPGFAFAPGGRLPRKLLKGKSARVVVTMGMPGLFYRWVYQANGLKAVERNILSFCGFSPVRSTVIGRIEAMTPRAREKWLARLVKFGRDAR